MPPLTETDPRRSERSSPARPGGSPARLAEQVPPRAFALGAAAVIALLAIPGALTVRAGGGGAFDLDAELTIPALVSSLLLLVAAAMAVAAHVAQPAPGTRAFLGLALLFAIMALDEATGLHEALEDALGSDWQTLYLPVMVLAAVAWALVLRRLRGAERAALALGAVCWGIAQVLEAVEWVGPREREHAVDGYGVFMGVEELLEMTGSALFGWALLCAARRWAGAGER